MGLQWHWNINYPNAYDVTAAMSDLIGQGIKVKVSELAISIYDDYSTGGFVPEPEQATLPRDLELLQAARHVERFQTFRSFGDHLTSVTSWGISDEVSWLDRYSGVPGRNDHPLLYDDDHLPKQAYLDLMKP